MEQVTTTYFAKISRTKDFVDTLGVNCLPFSLKIIYQNLANIDKGNASRRFYELLQVPEPNILFFLN